MKYMYLFKFGGIHLKRDQNISKNAKYISCWIQSQTYTNLFNNLGNLNTNSIMGNIKDVFNFLVVVMVFLCVLRII